MAEITDLEVELQIEKTAKTEARSLAGIPGLTPQQMLDHYSLIHPELSTATIGEAEITGNKLIYPVKQTLGIKG